MTTVGEVAPSRQRMRKLFPLLKILNSLDIEERTILLPYLTHEGCEGVYDCVYNGVMNPTLRAEDRQELHRVLIPHKRKLRRLLAEQDPAKKKRALLQLGAGASLLIEKVFPVLNEFVSK